jgi:hypothetical protein
LIPPNREEIDMAQRKDSPNSAGDGNPKSSGKGGGRSASSGVRTPEPRNTTIRGEKASPSGRGRGETSAGDRT